MKVLSIYHSSDLDGSMSGGIVGYWSEKMGYEVDYRPYNYGFPISQKDFNGYDLVFAVDISFHESDPWVYEYLGNRLVWIDHHKSAIEFKEKNPGYFKGVQGIQKSGKGACELVWEYLFPDSKTPKLVLYLSTYDTFNKTRPGFDWRKTEQIQFGCRQEYGISAKDMCNYLKLAELGLNDYIEDFRSKGENILDYLEKNFASKIKNYGTFIPEFMVEGLGTYRVMALNTNEFTSKAFEGLYDPRFYDIMMPYCVCPREGSPGKFDVRFSLYTEKSGIDVSKIAEIFQGGGHSQAAGGCMTLETLGTILGCGMSLKEYDSWLYATGKRKYKKLKKRI